ncbi:hypothetical protein ES703_124542 [subsurface metagenome]
MVRSETSNSGSGAAFTVKLSVSSFTVTLWIPSVFIVNVNGTVSDSSPSSVTSASDIKAMNPFSIPRVIV